jgi:LAO/AO transport system kinase
VLQISALQNHGLEELMRRLQAFHSEQLRTHAFEHKRAEQAVSWLWERVHSGLRNAFTDNPHVKEALPHLIHQVSKGALDASTAARRLLHLHQAPRFAAPPDLQGAAGAVP